MILFRGGRKDRRFPVKKEQAGAVPALGAK